MKNRTAEEEEEKQTGKKHKIYSNQKHSISFGLENWLIYLFVESTEKKLSCKHADGWVVMVAWTRENALI